MCHPKTPYFLFFDQKRQIVLKIRKLSQIFFQICEQIQFFQNFVTERPPIMFKIPRLTQGPLLFVIFASLMPLTLKIGAVHPHRHLFYMGVQH